MTAIAQTDYNKRLFREAGGRAFISVAGVFGLGLLSLNLTIGIIAVTKGRQAQPAPGER